MRLQDLDGVLAMCNGCERPIIFSADYGWHSEDGSYVCPMATKGHTAHEPIKQGGE